MVFSNDTWLIIAITKVLYHRKNIFHNRGKMKIKNNNPTLWIYGKYRKNIISYGHKENYSLKIE